jgi:hypothetical protein
VTVTKRRQRFIWEQVRIHLDDVERLGSFIEFETVAPEDSASRTSISLSRVCENRIESTAPRSLPAGLTRLWSGEAPLRLIGWGPPPVEQ